MPAHVLHGDSFLVARAQAGLESETGASSLLDANRHVLLGADIGLNGLMELCHAIPFMDPIRLVLVQGLLTTFEGKGQVVDPEETPIKIGYPMVPWGNGMD